MSSHKHGRERDGHAGSSSTRYYKDYHTSSGDHYALPKKRISTTTGSSRNYVSHSSGDRYYEEKKLHGHSGSSYHPYSSSTTTSSHRPQLSRSSGGNNYGGSGGDHHRYGGVVQRDSRKILKVDYGRKHYEKSSTSGIRRIPPPLSPPPPPLMKLPVPSSSASRYRQAPPEDRYQNQRSSHKEIHRASAHETASYVKRERIEEDRKPRKVTEKIRPRKRVVEADVKSGSPSPVESKKKKEKDDAEPDGEEIVEEEIAGDDEEINTEKEKEKEEKSEKEEAKEKRDEKEKDTKALLKLVCTYCDVRCVTFKDFTNHLRSFQHLKAMSGFVADTKRKLYSLKKAARDQQKEMEKTMDAAQKTLSDTSSYCRVCELDLRTDPKEHEDNEIHNEIKTIIHRKCEICDVDFRFWKVYVYHTVALEHVKRVALQDLKEKEARGENIKGTNLTLEELGMDLLEEKNVFYCKACVRYFPIREDLEDTKMRHCMSLGHIKYVEEYRNRLKWLKKREEADARDKLEAEKRREKKLKEEEEKKKEQEKEGSEKEAEGDAEDGEKTTSEIGVDVKEENEHQASDEEKDEVTENNEEEEDEKEEHDEPPPPEDDQDDEDEIQLHAEADESVEALDGDDDEEEDE